jgi:hypothetical protein
MPVPRVRSVARNRVAIELTIRTIPSLNRSGTPVIPSEYEAGLLKYRLDRSPCTVIGHEKLVLPHSR